MKSLDMRGCPAAISVHRDPSLRRARLAAIQKWLAAGSITPCVGGSYPRDQVREALQAKWESHHVGTVCVNP